MSNETIGAQLDMIGIVVSDMARSLAFYRLLGLEIPESADAEVHVEVPLRGGLRLGFDTDALVSGFHDGWTPPSSGEGRVGLAFLLPDAAAVDAAYERITGAGYVGVLEPFDAPWGQRYATVTDPDGSSLDLFAWVDAEEA
ncbi:putative glyoxalase superfamily protein PhnB [Pseudonocardia sediminis]|uniref:Putative glyoxalase superfamily protein PhnB n=1 Tax=Pseudonocardia sediminis TaxID=1397368 RepID=A0A4Q7V1D7_PSEST|nr:VOC family protein [Pseudonocardia sediminis]RZT86369.1 putative glyoxalase superfamily protein PhnB [Pseudonocardia sediminis]